MLGSHVSPTYFGLLIIEDDKEQAEFIKHILRECEWINHVETAQDGEKALELLSLPEHPNQDLTNHKPRFLPDAILLDLHLPKIQGLEVLKRIKSAPLTQQIPTIVLSASFIARDMKKSYDLGAISFLRKPVNPFDLISAMEHSLKDQHPI
jgi:two-component system response regulator